MDGRLKGFLFDLQIDPFELNNLYDKDNPQVKALRSSLAYLLKKTNDGFVLDEDEFDKSAIKLNRLTNKPACFCL